MGVLLIASLLAFIVQATYGYRFDLYNQAPDHQNRWFMVHEDNSAHSANHAYTNYPTSNKPQTENRFQSYNANPAPTAQFANIFNKFQQILTENRHVDFDNPHTRPQKVSQDLFAGVNHENEGDYSKFEDAYNNDLFSIRNLGFRESRDQKFYDSGNKFDETFNSNIFSKGNGAGNKYNQNGERYNGNIFPNKEIFNQKNEGVRNQNMEGYNRNVFSKVTIDGYKNESKEGYNGNIHSKGNEEAFDQYRQGKSSTGNDGFDITQHQEEYNQSEEVYTSPILHEELQNEDNRSYDRKNKYKLPTTSHKEEFQLQNKHLGGNTFTHNTPVRSSNQMENRNEDHTNNQSSESKEYEDSGESYGISYEDELRYNEQAEKAVESLYNKNISKYEDSTSESSNHIPFKSQALVSSFNQKDDDAAEVHYHQHKHMHNHKHTQEHKHEHEQSHKHAHISQNQHIHKNKEEHNHEHNNMHKHAHKHMQQHKHDHKDDHKHDHAHKHAHKEEHKHAHHEDHKHGHDHHNGHDHKHVHHGDHKHDHHHGHKHSHLSEHKHGHHHGHKHGHKHGNKHGHKHVHKHGHGNKHRHNHGHIHKKHH